MMTTLAAPTGNEIQNTLAATYERGVDTTVTLTDGADFPNSAHVIRISESSTKWCLVIYTTKATHVLTMGGGATDYALANNYVTDGTAVFAIGSTVELVCAADEIAQLFDAAIQDDVDGQIVAITEKTVPVANDEFLIEDSAASNAKKSLKLSNFNYRYIEYRVLAPGIDTAVEDGVGGEFRCPQAMTVFDVGAYVDTAPTGGGETYDIEESGSTILSTLVTIDATEKTSETATPPVISDAAIAADAIITFNIDAVGATTAAKGLTFWMKVLIT